MRSVRAQTYRNELDYLSDNVWSEVVTLAVRTQQFLPTVAELIEIAGPFVRHEQDEARPNGPVFCGPRDGHIVIGEKRLTMREYFKAIDDGTIPEA